MNKNLQNLQECVNNLNPGVTPKLTILKTRKPRKTELVLTSGYRTTGYRIGGVKIRGGNGHNAGGKVG